MAATFVGTLRSNAKSLLKLQDSNAKEFLRLLNDLRSDLYRQMSGMTGDMDVFKTRQIIHETEIAIRVLENRALGLYNGMADQALTMAVKHLEQDLGSLGKAFEPRPIKVNIEPSAVLADPERGLLANSFETSVQKYGLDVLSQVKQNVFFGVRRGLSVNQMANQILGKNGLIESYGKSNAVRLVRTEVSNAYNTANEIALKQAKEKIPGLQKMWVHIGSYPCKICMPLHGTSRALDGTWTIRLGHKTKEVTRAPAHPNCTCRTTAIKPSWKKAMKERGYLDQEKPEQL